MMQQQGQASAEWLLLALSLVAIFWIAQSRFDLVSELRELGKQVIEHFYFIFNYVALVPGSGL